MGSSGGQENMESRVLVMSAQLWAEEWGWGTHSWHEGCYLRKAVRSQICMWRQSWGRGVGAGTKHEREPGAGPALRSDKQAPAVPSAHAA